MVKSMFGAIAGLRTHQSKMDVISNNIANVNTWGYKSRSANFQDAMYQNLTNSTAGNTTAGGTGGKNSSQLGYGVNMGAITTNFTTGSWGYTGDASNCMINGSGFFIVGSMPSADGLANGIPADDLTNKANPDVGKLSLSRVGIFKLDSNGYLVDDSGNYVYGFEPTADQTGFITTRLKPIKLPAVTTGTPPEPDTISTISIAADGSITGVTTKGQQKVSIGQLAVASVQNPGGLEQSAGYLYDIADNAGSVSAIPTVASTTGEILSNYLEMSNVDLATEIANMITTQRGYQANSKIITVTDEMLEQLVNMKR